MRPKKYIKRKSVMGALAVGQSFLTTIDEGPRWSASAYEMCYKLRREKLSPVTYRYTRTK